MIDLKQVKDVGFSAIQKASEFLRDRFGQAHSIKKKGAIDLVTEADEHAERLIIDTILAEYPDHSILAEESGGVLARSPYQWIIDPLDGTTNFAHNLPCFSTSIALALNGETVFGVVENPVLQERFWAVKGEGAFLNGKEIRVSSTESLSESLLVTGFPYDLKAIIDTLLARFQRCLEASQGVRRLGSAAIDLCYVACGRFDGFWEQNLHPWDTDAGVLIVREAGGIVTDFAGGPHQRDMKEILATNGRIHEELIGVL
ncbi:MAG: inositol monophosphatase [Deltaproteobacteria bacterium]|nr:inositol monophosphatase [Deltaproteobacteria bacterium]